MKLSSVLLAATLATACAGNTSYDDSWGSEDLAGGKSDGLLDFAEPLAFGVDVSASVDSTSIKLYSIDLFAGDEVAISMNRTSGDLNPHVQLFASLSRFESAQSFDLGTGRVTKTYLIDSTDEYGVAARAFRNEGSGDYDLRIECLGGPCAGQFPDPDPALDLGEANSCIRNARECAFARLPDFGGAVGPVRSQQIWDGCMEQQHANGVSCETACEQVDGICEEFIAELPFYADQPAECTETLNDCMEICYDMAGISPFGSEPDAEAICFNGPLGGQCGNYARDHEACGGTVPANSGAECRALCQTTSGAWIDDLDVICDEECGFCSDAEDNCEMQCGSTSDSCFDSCLELEGCF